MRQGIISQTFLQGREVGLLGCSTWLERRFLKITFSQQEDDPIVDIDEIRELLDDDIKEAGDE